VGPTATVDVWSPLVSTGSFRDPSAGGNYTATANYGDGTGPQMLTLASNNSFSLSHAYAAPGVYTVTVSVNDQYGTGSSTFAVTVRPQSVYVLDAAAGGALGLSGNASLAIPGRLIVDSSSTTALSAVGNASVSAASIFVVGGASKGANATINGTLSTGAASFADPLAFLSGPGTTGLNNYSSASYSNGSHPLSPGIYSQISASGTASLMLSPGLYLIEGGGFTVTGSASISGSGVTIYNTVSTYPKAGGTYGGITLSGSGTFSLTAATAPTNGAYPGILIFQPGANTRAISQGGNGVLGLNGTIYAPSAPVTVTGNAQLKGVLVADRLSLSGNGVSTQVADGSAGSILDNANAGTLLAGNITVYVNDPSSYFTADELSRIQDAINTWDNLLAPYSVTISEVSDPTLANVVIDNGTTSAAGSAANGILGSYSSAGEITILQGWNWYAGADASAIGANQYDFQTVMTHELGHALGLGGSPDATSPMYEILATGVVRRTPTAADLNIPEPPEDADPEMAAGFNAGAIARLSSPVARADTVVWGTVPCNALATGQWSVPSGQPPAVSIQTGSPVSPEPTFVVQSQDHEPRRDVSLTGPDAGEVLDAALANLVTGAHPTRGVEPDGTGEVRRAPGIGDFEDGTKPEPITPDQSDPTGFVCPVEPSLHVQPVDSGLIWTDAISDVVRDGQATSAVRLPVRLTVPVDSIVRTEPSQEPGERLAKLAATLIVAGSWGHRARFGGVTSRQAGRRRDRTELK
jgi:hypothetical protein